MKYYFDTETETWNVTDKSYKPLETEILKTEKEFNNRIVINESEIKEWIEAALVILSKNIFILSNQAKTDLGTLKIVYDTTDELPPLEEIAKNMQEIYSFLVDKITKGELAPHPLMPR